MNTSVFQESDSLSSSSPPPNDEMTDISSDEAILVEYLDGELTLTDRQAIEERLAKEPMLREMLARLEKSWQYLDLLDKSGPDKEMVETTLETVVFSVETSLHGLKSQVRRRIFWKWCRIVLVAVPLVLLSFFIGGHIAGSQDALLRDASPIIERLDMYLMLSDSDPDVELLRILAERRLFLPPLPEDAAPVDPADYRPSPHTHVLDTHVVAPLPLSELKRRMKRIKSFEPVFYSQFYWSCRKFLDLSMEQKTNLRRIHDAIVTAPRSYELFLTLENYYHWFKALQSYERTEIRKSGQDVAERADRIAALKQRLGNAQDFRFGPSIAVLDSFSDEKTEVQELAHVLRNLDSEAHKLDEVLNAAPEQAIQMLLQYHLEQLP